MKSIKKKLRRCTINQINETRNAVEFVGRGPLNAPKIAGCSGNSPYIFIEEADDDRGIRRASLPTTLDEECNLV
jgi:hypothetical protein